MECNGTLWRWKAGLALAALAGTVLAAAGPWVARGVCFDDSGDLQAASATLGIAHPPGYAVYVSVGHVLTWLPGVEPARAVNLGALLAGLGALLAGAAGLLVALMVVTGALARGRSTMVFDAEAAGWLREAELEDLPAGATLLTTWHRAAPLRYALPVRGGGECGPGVVAGGAGANARRWARSGAGGGGGWEPGGFRRSAGGILGGGTAGRGRGSAVGAGRGSGGFLLQFGVLRRGRRAARGLWAYE